MAVKISRILHAGYVLECQNVKIAFDPIFENPFSGNCYAFPEVKFDYEQIRQLSLDAVFISHYHDDHCSLDSLNFLNRKTAIYVYCLFEELLSWIRQLGFENVHPLQLDSAVQVGPFEVIPRRALDADVDSMFHVRAEGLNILNVVDSWIDYQTVDELARRAHWDFVMWPFQTMREVEVLAPSRSEPASTELPPEWIEQLQQLRPKYIVPSSCQFAMEPWSWYNHSFFPISYQQFADQIQTALPKTQVVRMNPSVSVILGADSLLPGPALEWIQPLGPQNVDYHYQADIKPPATAEIAQNFPALTTDQAERVWSYCQSELIEKYRALEFCNEGYFQEARVWQLSVYDHLGRARCFFYKLQGENIERQDAFHGPVSWLTEVSGYKLYRALECGESLTSMYVRINDCVFSSQIEEDIKNADVMEDPLIRCLFNGAFGSYQLAQLKRLLK